MINTQQYKHIIWDWNGTLLNDAWLFVDIMNGILKKLNMQLITIETYQNIFGFPIKEYYKKLGFDLKNKSFDAYGVEFMNIYMKRKYEAKLYPMTIDVLLKLNNNNINHSILSAAQQNILEDLTKYYNINHYFSHIDGVDNYHANGKIKRGLNLIKKLNIKPNTILLVGDTIHDFEVAKAIGSDCLLISNGHNSYERLKKTGAPIIKNITNILSLFSI